MSDDFVRLVSQANPAFRQYQPANNGYPPSSSFSGHSHSPSGQVLDPFFDDEDDDIPDSAFGRPIPMQSKESGLPLAQAGAPPAGLGNSQISLPRTAAPDWSFDDNDTPQTKSLPFSGSSSIPSTSQTHVRKPSHSLKKRWKWPWQTKEQVLTGERVIALNSPEANIDFCSNHVSTSKYNSLTFVPKFLFGS